MPPRKVPDQARTSQCSLTPCHYLEADSIGAQYERYQMIDDARQCWEGLTKDHPHSYAVWYGRADFETCVWIFIVPLLPTSLMSGSRTLQTPRRLPKSARGVLRRLLIPRH